MGQGPEAWVEKDLDQEHGAQGTVLFLQAVPSLPSAVFPAKGLFFPLLSMETFISEQSDVPDLEEESVGPVGQLSSSKEKAVMHPCPSRCVCNTCSSKGAQRRGGAREFRPLAG